MRRLDATRPVRRRRAIATAMARAFLAAALLAVAQAALAVQYVESTIYDPTPGDPNSGDECLIDFVAPQDTPQSRTDVGNMRAAFEFALDNSDDMKAKVKGACEKQGFWITVVLFRDRQDILDGETAANGIIALDPGDLDANRDNMVGDAADVQWVQDHTYILVLAHEFDHNQDGPGESEHDDPTAFESLAGIRGKPVDDENKVMEDLGTGIVRRNYGRHNPFNGKERVDFTVNGRPVTLYVNEHVDARRKARKRFPSTVFTVGPSLVLFSPGEPCLPGGSSNCFPLIGAVDVDHDGVPDPIDNCIDLPNPQQSDVDGDGVGSRCDHDDDGDGARRGVEAATGSADHDPNAMPEHWACAGEPAACGLASEPCTDGIDNDLDGRTDLFDPGCVVPIPGGIEFPESTPPGQLVPDYHREDLGGVPEKQDALLATATVRFDWDLDGTVDSVTTARGAVAVGHFDADTNPSGFRRMQGFAVDMRFIGTDPEKGSYFLSTEPARDHPFELTAKQTGSDFPASGRIDFTLELDPDTLGPLDPVIAGLQSTFVPHWQPFETVWNSFGPPMIFNDTATGTPVVEIVSMTVRFERDTDLDGSFDPFDNCPEDPNPGQEDGDSDGAGDVCDCGAADGTVWSRPPGVTISFVDLFTLAFSPDGPPGSVFDVFDVVESPVADDLVNAAVCVGTNVPPFASGVTITSTPAPGQASYYLGQLENGCPGTEGEGPTGTRSDGTPHVIRDCD